MEKMNPNY